jgi:hypothetical protein
LAQQIPPQATSNIKSQRHPLGMAGLGCMQTSAAVDTLALAN